jgi:CheY-like chemotaxis protein
MTRKILLKRISAAAIIALDTFMVVFTLADLFLVLYLGYSMPRGEAPWYYKKEITPDGCVVWRVDPTPALILASLAASMGGIAFDRRIAKKRKGIAPIIIVVTAAALATAVAAIAAKSYSFCPLACKQWTCNGEPPKWCWGLLQQCQCH